MSDASVHLEFERLTDLALGDAAEAEKSAVAEHLQGCGRCSTKYARIAKTIGVMQADRLEEVPAHILERTFAIIDDRPVSAIAPTIIDRLTAILRFETSTQVPAFGMRSNQSSTAHRLWFTIGEFDVDLRIGKNRDAWDLDGQVFGSVIGNRAVLRSGLTEYSSDLSDAGEFSFAGVKDGEYSLVLDFADFEIDIPTIRISD